MEAVTAMLVTRALGWALSPFWARLEREAAQAREKAAQERAADRAMERRTA